MRFLAIILFCICPLLMATPISQVWTIDNVKREALICIPSVHNHNPYPLIFVFHSHGDYVQQASQTYPIYKYYPEAIVIYMQCLPTPNKLIDAQGLHTGWQAHPKDQNSRDLKFFDAVLLSTGSQYHIDPKRIYALGHSDGGMFVYLLWGQRGQIFAAYSISEALPSPDYGFLQPTPVLCIAGRNDNLVKFEWQQLMIDKLLDSNHCLAGHLVGGNLTLYDSSINMPVMTYIHLGGHIYPPESIALSASFFKAYPKP